MAMLMAEVLHTLVVTHMSIPPVLTQIELTHPQREHGVRILPPLPPLPPKLTLRRLKPTPPRPRRIPKRRLRTLPKRRNLVISTTGLRFVWNGLAERRRKSRTRLRITLIQQPKLDFSGRRLVQTKMNLARISVVLTSTRFKRIMSRSN